MLEKALTSFTACDAYRNFIIIIIIIIIIQKLYSVIMPLGGYQGAGEQVGRVVNRKQ